MLRKYWAQFCDAAEHHPRLIILACALVPVLLRLAALPWIPAPIPQVHDEFSHLLVASTLSAGRLANPAHPLSNSLETIYVLQEPTYASIYPVGQGALLALGQAIAGHPWAGVLISVALMSGAGAWLLLGLVPPAWAAIGGSLAALHFGLAPRWIDSYWGGALTAFGGSLFFGAAARLPGVASNRRAYLGLVSGLGWCIVWLTRPFEAVPLLFIQWGLLCRWALTCRGAERRRWLVTAGTASVGVLAALLITVAHNRAVTGSFTTLPYVLSRSTYGVPQSFLWEKPVPRPAELTKESAQLYDWQRQKKDALTEHPVRNVGAVAHQAFTFSVGQCYAVPFLVGAVCAFFSNSRWALIVLGMAVVVSSVYPFFFPHYVAAYASVVSYIVTIGLMRISRWLPNGFPAGPVVVAVLTLGAFGLEVREQLPIKTILGLRPSPHPVEPLRYQISRHLAELEGRDVVIVRYLNGHRFHDEWVYNDALVDEADIIWSRDRSRSENDALADYYSHRHIWYVDVAPDSARLSRYGSPHQEPTFTATR